MIVRCDLAGRREPEETDMRTWGGDGREASRSVRLGAVCAGAAVLGLLAACSNTSDAATSSGGGKVIKVVAAENFWGSIATQLGGSHVQVLSVVSDPNADPHDYESSASDARAVAEADYVIENGVGYDAWCDKLLSASPNSSRHVYNVGDTVGKKDGDNPHLWYNPDYVVAAENHIEADLKATDPADADYFTAQRTATDKAFAPMRARLAEIKKVDAGKTVASTESIFVYLANYLGLNLISPPEFMEAVAEGNDPPAASVAAFQQQLSGGTVQTLVYNEQTATAVTSSLKQLATSKNIPVIGVTETIQPADTPFQDWFNSELLDLQNALNPSLTQ
jgi:zinc/manganese transport system substrate-binding protein